MRVLTITLSLCIASLLSACGTSPREKRDVAEARYYEEKTKIMKEYKECVDDAGTDTAKLDACERLLRAIQTSPAPSPGDLDQTE